MIVEHVLRGHVAREQGNLLDCLCQLVERGILPEANAFRQRQVARLYLNIRDSVWNIFPCFWMLVRLPH